LQRVGGEFVVREEVTIMKKRASMSFLTLIATVMLSALSVAVAGPGGGHGGGGHGGGGHGGGGFHSSGGFHGRGGYRGYGWQSWHGWRGGYYGGMWGPWAAGLGIYLPLLPWYYQTYWADDVPYYYADGMYYAWDTGVGEYQAVQPPAGLTETPPQDSAALPEEPQIASELFAYPKSGQSEAQQKQDRDECRRWAAAETGVDPTQPAEEVGAAIRRSYLQVEAACLGARNYSVR
jgi:hypothetical protein